MTIALIVIIVVVALIALYVVSIFNSLIRLRNRADEGFSDIDVQLKRRHDLIPNLVETVKGYAAHERGVFENVTEARSALLRASTPAEAAAANERVTAALGRLFAV